MSTRTPATGGVTVARPRPLFSDRRVQGLRLMTDLHLGAANTDLDLIQAELEAADEAGDRILIGGDLFDAIMPRDRRFEAAVVHPRLRGRTDLLNGAVEWAVEILAPYAGLIDGIGVGNHETAAEKAGGFEPVRATVAGLKSINPSIQYLGYTAWVQYQVRTSPEAKRNSARYTIWYHHGSGKGDKPETALKRLRDKATSVAADLYWTGHHHAVGNIKRRMQHFTKDGEVITKDQHFVLTGSYMTVYGTQSQEDYWDHGRVSNYAADASLEHNGMGGARVLLHWAEPGFPTKVEVVQ